LATVFSLKKQFALLLLAILLAGDVFFVTRVSAAQPGVVCIVSVGTDGCPQTSPVFSGSLGTNLTVAVNIQGAIPTNGFDISILTDPSLLNPVAIDYNATILPSPHQVWNECINGNLVIGGGCSGGAIGPQVPGVAELAMSSFYGLTAPTTGVLFTVTFNILGKTNSTIGYQTGCRFSSVVGTTTCVEVTQIIGGQAALQPIAVVDPEFFQSLPLYPISFNQNVSFQGVTVNASGSLSVDSMAMSINGTVIVNEIDDSTGAIIFSKTFTFSLSFAGVNNKMFGFDMGPSGLVLSCMLSASPQAIVCAVTGNPDLMHTGRVDFVDAAALGLPYGSSPGSANWNPAADLNRDGKVDILDATQVAIDFGMTVLS
jgi:hypothetical protein